MAYDADDPDNLLGGRRIPRVESGLPSGPFRAKGQLRGLTGDVRRIIGFPRGQSGLVIDVEYDTPRALMVIASSQRADDLTAEDAEWRIKIGIDRSPLGVGNIELSVTNFTRVMVARSVQLTAVNNSDADLLVSATIVPIDVSADPSQFSIAGLSLPPQVVNGRANTSIQGSIAQTVVPLGTSIESIPNATTPTFRINSRQGFSIWNDAAATLYVRLGSGGLFGPADATIPIAPNGYYQTEPTFTGTAQFLWAAAGAGFARVTIYGFNPDET